jgi:hypothetical protein
MFKKGKVNEHLNILHILNISCLPNGAGQGKIAEVESKE